MQVILVKDIYRFNIYHNAYQNPYLNPMALFGRNGKASVKTLATVKTYGTATDSKQPQHC